MFIALNHLYEVSVLKGIYKTLTGKYVTERRIEMVANNIANALTPGYKSSKPLLNSAEEGNVQRSELSGVNTQVNSLNSYINFTNAPLVETGNQLDLGIEGDGFFVVSVNGKNMYTANGQFTLNKEKKLVTLDGYPVMGEGGEITLDGKDIKVESDGTIYVDKNQADKIKVVTFEDKSSLKNYGGSMFVNIKEGNAEITPERYSVKQGFYEASNVNVMQEMIDMMSALRAYESYSKVDQFFGDMIGKLINLGRF